MGKRGRKPKNVPREANGRPSRRKADRQEMFDRDQRENMSVAIEARKRHYGLNDKQAKDQRAGDVIGRMRMSGDTAFGLTERQYQALVKYRTEMQAFRIAIHAPKDARAIDLNITHGISVTDGEAWDRWAEKAKARGIELIQVIQSEQIAIGGQGVLLAALDVFVMRDTFQKHMVGNLRIAANALVRYYGFERVAA